MCSHTATWRNIWKENIDLRCNKKTKYLNFVWKVLIESIIYLSIYLSYKPYIHILYYIVKFYTVRIKKWRKQPIWFAVAKPNAFILRNRNCQFFLKMFYCYPLETCEKYINLRWLQMWMLALELCSTQTIQPPVLHKTINIRPFQHSDGCVS